MRRWPLIWALLAAALFGASTPACKGLVDRLGPFLLAGVLYAGAGIAVAPWALRGVTLTREIRGKNITYFFGAIFFGGVAGPVLLLMALALAPAGSVSLWLNLELVATAVLATLFFREHLHAPTWIAVALIVGASVLLAPGSSQGGMSALLVAGACVCWGLDNNFTALIDKLTPAQTTFAKGLIAGFTNIVIGLSFTEVATIQWADIGLALGIGALAYGASVILYITSAQQMGATRSQVVFSTAPAWGLALAWIWLRDPVLPHQVGAALLMAVGIWLMQRERHGHRHTHERLEHTHRHRHDDGHHTHTHDPPMEPGAWHSHEHTHEPLTHSHPHEPDLHHRHEH